MNSDQERLIESLQLGESKETVVLHGRALFRLATERMADQARRRIDIFSYDLDKPLYDQVGFLEAAKRLAIHTPGVAIRILLQNSEPVQKEGHRILALARRLTSKIEIKRPHPDDIDHPENFMIVDSIGVIRRKISERYEGEVNFCQPLEAKLLTEFFTQVWDRSEPESALRRLYL